MDTTVTPAPAPTLSRTRISERRACRVCGRGNLLSYLDLGVQPLANDLREPNELNPRVCAPLVLQSCASCKLSQLSHVVPKEVLYAGTYAYSSGVSAGWHAHCDALAGEYARMGRFVIDIAANDGTLLGKFTAHGAKVLGVEPSLSFVGLAYQKLSAFWTRKLVESNDLIGRADLIIAQNVLGHVDDVHDFMEGIKQALAPAGRAIIEVPYLLSLFASCAFDTIYHEHLSYWTVTALKTLADAHGLVLTDVQRLSVHGGSLRAIFAHEGTPSAAVTEMLALEQRDLKRPTYMSFSARATRAMAAINDALLSAVPYAGFGAAAKCTVLLNTLDIRAYPRVVYDETPDKQGKHVPGTRVPIEAPPTDWSAVHEPIAVFAWNWSDVIIRKLRDAGYAGDIFVPLPKPRWDCI